MSDDFKILPTRTGPAMGHALERQMSDAVNDPNGFRTRVVTNLDGSTTMLRTRGGFAEFTTTQVGGTQPITLEETAYEDRVWHEDHPFYLAGDYLLPFKYLKEIKLKGGTELCFERPPEDRLENEYYHPAEIVNSADNMMRYVAYRPKKALQNRGTSLIQTILFRYDTPQETVRNNVLSKYKPYIHLAVDEYLYGNAWPVLTFGAIHPKMMSVAGISLSGSPIPDISLLLKNPKKPSSV